MSELKTLRIFVSSPGDVADERALAERVLRRLGEEYRSFVHLELVLWEHEPVFAHTGYQQQIAKPSECDLVICILWSKLGTRLPEGFAAGSGEPAPTGTEYEIRDALEGYRLTGMPNLLIYRKSLAPQLNMTSAEARERLRQIEELDDFCRQTFYDEHGAIIVAHTSYADSRDFERKLLEHVRRWLAVQLGQAPPKFPRRRIVLAAALALLAVALAAPLANNFWLSKHATTKQSAASATSITTPAAATVSDKSIAVLPFTDMSEKKDQEYFADGMAEEILDLLARIPGLTVIGRTSSFQFKGKSDDLRTIGAKLSAAYILEGSVRKSGDRLRVTAQLIDSRSGTHLWSDTYDRDMTDVLKLQDEIASGIVRAMEVTVGADELRQRTSINNMDAYQFYLRGRHAFDRYDRDGDDEAAADFKKALDLDPAFAEAAVYLAFTRNQQAINGFIDYAGGFEEARRIAENALRIDPSLAVGHCALADYYTRLAWDWPAADREAKRAVELDPGGVIPLHVSAVLATSLGHWDEAVSLLNAAIEFDPLNAGLYWDLGNARYRSGRYPEAEAAFRRVLQIAPTFVSAHFELGRVLLEAGHPRDALDEMERESPEPYSGRTLGLAMVYYALGRRTDSDAAVKRLAAEGGDDWPFGMAEAYAFRGEADKAIQWLDRAYTTKDELQYIKGNPTFRKIERDPRYNAFLQKMKLLD